MPSERVQRRVDRLLDQAEEAVEALDWSRVREVAGSILVVDPDNDDARSFLAMAEHNLVDAPVTDPTPSTSSDTGAAAPAAPPSGQAPLAGEGDPSEEEPASFANGRYQVSKFLGEGGKKRVYQAHDTLLDRDVAFALIKTEGFDDTSRERITREAQAMGRLGTHPNIVTVFDLG
ncbi:MAG: hypothetical protein IIC92_06055, partial [Chloroflexi bacterium]|nr:hypothetical protein [Chloroflexota bacterium]